MGECLESLGLDTPDAVESGMEVAGGSPAVRCEPFQGPESPSSLPACATVQAVLSAGPSGDPDWVGFQDLYDTARGIFDLCNTRDPGGVAWTDFITNLLGSRTQISVSYASAFLVPGWQLLTLCLYAGPVAWIMLSIVRQLCPRGLYIYALELCYW